MHDKNCTCVKFCDCQNPPPDNWDGRGLGVWGVSNSCPIHNVCIAPDPNCPLHGHMDKDQYSEAKIRQEAQYFGLMMVYGFTV